MIGVSGVDDGNRMQSDGQRRCRQAGVTVPVGVPTPGETALTVAVKVTAWPDADGFTDEVTVVELLALLTVCVIAAEVLVLKLASPA